MRNLKIYQYFVFCIIDRDNQARKQEKRAGFFRAESVATGFILAKAVAPLT